MDANRRGKGLGSSSVHHSETTVESLRAAGIVCAASDLLDEKRPPRWGDTPPQRTMHARFRRQRDVILDAFCASNDPQIAKRLRRMEACCVCPMYCLNTAGLVSVAPGFCRDRLCPTCASCRGRIVQARVAAACRDMDQTRFITLTVQCNGQPLAERLDHLYASFRRMRQGKIWKSHVRGGMAVLEVTRNQTTGHWHPHLHVLADGVYFDHKSLKRAWEEATGDSMVVDIRAVVSRANAARYVAAYVAKPAEVHAWAPAAVAEYALALHGRRLVVAFGSMHGKLGDPDDDGTRPKLVGILCSSLRLHRARDAGCPYAEFASTVLARVGGVQRAAQARHDEARPHDASTPTDSECQRLVIALKRVGGDLLAWLPEIEPHRKFAGQSNAGRRPRDATLRLWTEEPWSGSMRPSHSDSA